VNKEKRGRKKPRVSSGRRKRRGADIDGKGWREVRTGARRKKNKKKTNGGRWRKKKKKR